MNDIVLYEKGFFIIQEEKTFQKLNSKGFGFKLDKNIFALLSYEALYLLEKKKITIVDKKNNSLDFTCIFKREKVNLEEYLVFKDLTLKGFLVKSGLKYGVSFRAYEKNVKSSHSEYLIDIYKNNLKCFLKDLTGKSRVAHSTRKNLLLAIVDEEKSITYISFDWKRI